jgi:hypothetical protein
VDKGIDTGTDMFIRVFPGDLGLAGDDRSSKKWVEAGTNYGSWRLIDRSGKSSQTTYVARGTTDSIIIINYMNC